MSTIQICPCPRKSLEERDTIDPLHGDPHPPVKDEPLIDTNDVGMRELRNNAILSIEIGRSPNASDKRLKSHGCTVRPGLAPVDATHAALRKQAKDLVLVVANEQPPPRKASRVDEGTLVMIEVAEFSL